MNEAQLKRRLDVFIWLDAYMVQYDFSFAGWPNWCNRHVVTEQTGIPFPGPDDTPEVIEYFARRLGSPPYDILYPVLI